MLEIGFSQASYLGQGNHCRAFGHQDQVCKIARHPEAASGLVKEADFLRRFQPTSVAVPRILRTGPGFVIESYLEGTPITRELWNSWSTQKSVFSNQLWSFLKEFPSGWVHGDLSPDHILVHPASGQITGVIDFGDVGPGELDYELRYLYEDMGPGFFGEFCSDPDLYQGAAYHSIRDTLDYLRENPQAAAGVEQQLDWQRRDLAARAIPWPQFD